MQSSKEKIEAQLCAYIDGDVTDAERAEIERHLEANPHHRELIQDLQSTRDLLRAMPRASIPGELNESLTGQLERSSLLDPGDDDETHAHAVNRWPQFTAVAAVLLLAIGLGVVVFYALPNSAAKTNLALGPAAANPPAKRADVARTPTPAGTPAPDTTAADVFSPAPTPTPTPADLGKTLDDSVALKSTTDRLAAAPAPTTPLDPIRAMEEESPTLKMLRARTAQEERNLATDKDVAQLREKLTLNQPAVPVAGEPAAEPAPTPLAPAAVAMPSIPAAVAPSLTPTPPAGAAAAAPVQLFLYVTSDKPQDAATEVTAYFRDNRIEYRAAPGGDSPRGRGYAAAPVTNQQIAGEVAGAAPVASAGRAPEELAQKAVPEADHRFGGARRAVTPGQAGSDLAVAGGDAPARKTEAAAATTPTDEGNAKAKSAKDAAPLADTTAVESRQEAARPAPTQKDADAKSAATTSFFGLQLHQGLFAGGAAPSAGNVLVARMNRRQLNELSSTLTRVDGQRAELKEIAEVDLSLSVGNLLRLQEAEGLTYRGSATAATTQPNDTRSTVAGAGGFGVESTPPASTQTAAVADQATTPSASAQRAFRDPVATQPSPAAKPTAATDSLRLDADPMDHPLDVVIVLQPAPPTAPAAVTPAEPAKK